MMRREIYFDDKPVIRQPRFLIFMVLQILGVSMGDAFLDKNLLGYVAEGIQSTLVNIVPSKHV